MNTFEDRINNYKQLQDGMLKTFIAKDSDYGDSFGKTFDKYGIVSALTRMSDKLNRLDNLASSNTTMQVDESIEDTLLDLANYAMLTYLEIHKFDEPVPGWSVSPLDNIPNVSNEGTATEESNKKALANIRKTVKETQAKGSNKEEDVPLYRPTMGTGDFHRRQLEITKYGAKFHWVDTDETLELEETADYQAYMNSHESLEDMVNNLYPQLIN